MRRLILIVAATLSLPAITPARNHSQSKQPKRAPIMFADKTDLVFQGKWQTFDGGASGDLTWIRCGFSDRECAEIDAYVLSASTKNLAFTTPVPAIWETE